MKKWIKGILVFILLAVVGFCMFLYRELQPPKQDVKYSPNEKYSIYQTYGSENQELPYASVVYIERHSIVSFLNTQEIIFMGYCVPKYVWLDDSKVKVSCEAEGSPIAKNNSFGIDIVYEVQIKE